MKNKPVRDDGLPADKVEEYVRKRMKALRTAATRKPRKKSLRRPMTELQRAIHKSRKNSPMAKLQASMNAKSQYATPEGRKKASEGQKRVWEGDTERKSKFGNWSKKFWADPTKAELHAKIRYAPRPGNKVKWAEPEYKKKMSAVRKAQAKKLWQNPEYRAKKEQGKGMFKAGVPQPTIKCEFCGEEHLAGHYAQFHGSKCKLNPNRPADAMKTRTNVTCPHCAKEGVAGGFMTVFHFENCKKNPNPPPKPEPTKVKCPHCGEEGTNKGIMARYHFDNCLVVKPERPKNKYTPATFEYATCPHCGKTGVAHMMRRWHFDNCKHKQ